MLHDWTDNTPIRLLASLQIPNIHSPRSIQSIDSIRYKADMMCVGKPHEATRRFPLSVRIFDYALSVI